MSHPFAERAGADWGIERRLKARRLIREAGLFMRRDDRRAVREIDLQAPVAVGELDFHGSSIHPHAVRDKTGRRPAKSLC